MRFILVEQIMSGCFPLLHGSQSAAQILPPPSQDMGYASVCVRVFVWWRAAPDRFCAETKSNILMIKAWHIIGQK